ncbi:MAG: O-antigen ligase family protein [Flavobacteriales bacterium]|nr:O-antigen ligase family protein [Flavobacteriales bacterium]
MGDQVAPSIARLTPFERVASWVWLLVCALAPISGRLMPVPMTLSIVLLLVVLMQRRPLPYVRLLWPLAAFYLLHVVGMLWSTDISFGLFDLQVKLGLVLLPLAACAFTALYPDGLHRSMLAFTAGTGVAIVLSVWKATLCYRTAGDPGCFSQSTFSYDLHPSYAAWYACWALAYWGLRAVRSGSVRLAVVPMIIVLGLSVFIIMLASKSGLIGLFLVVGVIIITWMKRSSPRHWLIAVGAGTVVLVALVLLGGGRVVDRVRVAFDALGTAQRGDPALYASEGGSEMRLVAWQCSAELLPSAPLGSGTGDVKHALVGCYEAKGARAAAEKRLNAHSQFLQGGVALGWPGLIMALLIGMVPLWVACKRNHLLLGMFAGLFIINAAVESVLEVQAGVVLVGIVLGLLAQHRTSYPTEPKAQT